MADAPTVTELRCSISFAPWFKPLVRAAAIAARLRLVSPDLDRFTAWCLARGAVRVQVARAA